MVDLVDKMIEDTIGVEGEYSNHPSDLGGPTRWGITQAVARKHGYLGDMKTFPRDAAKIIYKKEYYIQPGYAQVALVSQKVAVELFDTGVNMGQYYASCFLQTALNAFNRDQKDYPDITVDGQIGPRTITVLRSFFQVRKDKAEIALLKALNVLQGARYLYIADQRKKNEDFVFGWIMNRVEI